MGIGFVGCLLGILFLSLSVYFDLFSFLGVALIVPGIMVIVRAIRLNKLVLAIVGGAVLILVLIFSVGSGGENECDICGKPIFLGRFCEEHFNDWAD